MPGSPLLHAKGIVKRFPGMVALDHVDFDLLAGEVHGLMGENGAGKSTLLKVVSGVYTHDEGSLELDGQGFNPRSPKEAASHGVRAVYQEVNLALNLSVAENLVLGIEQKQSPILSWTAMIDEADEVLNRLGLQIDAKRSLSSYSLAIQQLVAIGRAVKVTPRVLILDEPTSSLDAAEVDQVFGVVRRLRDEGIGIIFVSHFLGQVYDFCDRLTVLRNGRVVGVGKPSELNQKQLIEMMIGHEVSAGESSGGSQGQGQPLLVATDLSRKGSVEDVSFTAHEGEIVGLVGLLGSGRTETLRLLFGADRRTKGSFQIGSKPTTAWSCRKAIRNRLGFCTEDRKLHGIIPGLSVRENIVLALRAKLPLWKPLTLAQQQKLANDMVTALQIKTTDIDKPIELLSGGNQQKCMLARWLILQPQILLLDEPTRGVDVGAKEEILKLLDKLRAEGMSLIIADSELPEIVRLAHRVAVFRDGKMVETLEGDEVTQDNVFDAIAKGGAT